MYAIRSYYALSVGDEQGRGESDGEEQHVPVVEEGEGEQTAGECHQERQQRAGGPVLV